MNCCLRNEYGSNPYHHEHYPGRSEEEFKEEFLYHVCTHFCVETKTFYACSVINEIFENQFSRPKQNGCK